MAAHQFFLPFRPGFDPNGAIGVGYQLRFRLTGTNAAATVYADAERVTPLPNPVVANAAGRWPTIYLDANVTYRVDQLDASGAQIDSIDPYIPGFGEQSLVAAAEQAAADRIQTGQDRIAVSAAAEQVAADRVQTGQDVVEVQEQRLRIDLALQQLGRTATTSGLLFRSDDTLAGWTGGAGAWLVVDTPTMVAFDRSPILAQASGTGSDAGGVREGHLFIDDDGKWYLYYGAGNGSPTDPGGPWRVHLARSVDRGITWTKLGPLNPQLGHGYDSGTYAAADMLYMEKRNGKYLLHRMSAGGVADNQIPGIPYYSDLWTADVITGPYTYIRGIVSAGAPGAFDDRDAYAGSVVDDGLGTYHLFYSAVTQGGVYQIGRATSNNPQGPFTKVPGPVITNNFFKGEPENPKVSWHPGLNCWVMLTNQVVGDRTRYNRIFFSRSLTDWDKAKYVDVMPISPMAGSFAIGIPSGFYTSSNVPELDFVSNPLGAYPITYDSDPDDNAHNHVDRKLFYTTLEPSARGVRSVAALFEDDFSTRSSVGVLGGQGGWIDDSRAAPKPGVIAGQVLDMGQAPGGAGGSPLVLRDFPAGSIAQSMTVTIGAGCSVAMVFAYKPTPGLGNFYYFDFGADSIVAGGFDGTSAVLIKAVAGLVPGRYFCEVVYNPAEGRFYVYVSYQLLFTVNLGTAEQATMAAGGRVGLRNGSGGTGQRLVHDYEVSAPALGTETPQLMPLQHGSFMAEFALRPAHGAASYDFYYLLQDEDSVESGYRLRLDLGGANAACGGVYRRVGGSETQIAGATSTRTQKATPNGHVAIRVSVMANVHRVWVNGELQFQSSDDAFTTGEAFGFRAKGDVDRRFLSIRRSSAVTVFGVTPGQVVTLRGSGGYPLDRVTATGTSVVLEAAHYPATSLDVDGVQRYAPAGGIWGGDVFV